MKKLLLPIIVLISLSSQGQIKKQSRKISIGYSFTPEYSFRSLKNKDGSGSASMVINSRNDNEIAKFGYTTGLNAGINFSELVGFETGIQFSNKGYKTKEQDLIYFPPSPGSPTKVKINYTYQYIGIPLKARFSVGKNKVRFISSIGFMTNFLINAKQVSDYTYADGKTDKKRQSSSTSGFNKVDISPMVSMGIDYNLNNKIHIVAEPMFKYGLIKIKDAPVAENLWSAGVNIGFYFTLK